MITYHFSLEYTNYEWVVHSSKQSKHTHTVLSNNKPNQIRFNVFKKILDHFEAVYFAKESENKKNNDLHKIKVDEREANMI